MCKYANMQMGKILIKVSDIFVHVFDGKFQHMIKEILH